MERSNNALAELAVRLGRVIIPHPKTRIYNDLLKAARIVAELAKVNTLGPKNIPGDISLYTAYAKCRAIAEEGAKDGK